MDSTLDTSYLKYRTDTSEDASPVLGISETNVKIDYSFSFNRSVQVALNKEKKHYEIHYKVLLLNKGNEALEQIPDNDYPSDDKSAFIIHDNTGTVPQSASIEELRKSHKRVQTNGNKIILDRCIGGNFKDFLKYKLPYLQASAALIKKLVAPKDQAAYYEKLVISCCEYITLHPDEAGFFDLAFKVADEKLSNQRRDESLKQIIIACRNATWDTRNNIEDESKVDILAKATQAADKIENTTLQDDYYSKIVCCYVNHFFQYAIPIKGLLNAYLIAEEKMQHLHSSKKHKDDAFYYIISCLCFAAEAIDDPNNSYQPKNDSTSLDLLEKANKVFDKFGESYNIFYKNIICGKIAKTCRDCTQHKKEISEEERDRYNEIRDAALGNMAKVWFTKIRDKIF